jgi:hypothetical protein
MHMTHHFVPTRMLTRAHGICLENSSCTLSPSYNGQIPAFTAFGLGERLRRDLKIQVSD